MSHNYTNNNDIELVKNGPVFVEKILSMINSANKCIFFHMYIFDYDQSSKQIIEALINKSKEKVDIYLLIDGFGSKGFPTEIIEKLKNNFINFNFFSPVSFFSLNQIGRRLHQKVILIDAEMALIGGTNISQEFIQPEKLDPWLDYACIIKGEEIARLQRKMKRLYFKTFPQKKSSIEMLLKLPIKRSSNKVKLKVIENDYTRLKREVQKSYHQSIKQAQDSIYITATYFLPGRKLLQLLKKAAKRGVEVNLIFGDYSDLPSYNSGSMSLFSWYLKNNINIYKWNKAIIHGKLALIDKKIVNIGSYNHNLISQYANLEMNVEINNQEFGKLVNEEIKQITSQSEKVDLKKYESIGLINKGLNYIAYLFSSVFDLIQLLLIKK